MFNYVWPIMLVVLFNVMYQICAKGVSGDVNPFASLTVTYVVGAICSTAMYFILDKQGNLVEELGK